MGGRVCNLNKQIWYDWIQYAVNDANNGDIIQVWPGIFEEDIDISGKSITLRSTDPSNWNVVENTIIYGSNYGAYWPYAPVIGLNNDSFTYINSTITGLTIKHGFDGISMFSANPNITLEIENCIIEGNYSSGITSMGFSPSITNCYVRNNNFGIAFDQNLYETPCPTIFKTIVEKNISDGISSISSDPCIISCIVRDNGRYGIFYEGANVLIKNNFIFNNGGDTYPQIRLGSLESGAVVRNNTIVSQTGYGIELYSSNPQIINCIIWCYDPIIGDDYNITYSCVNETCYGIGNMDDYPLFYNPDANNFHLSENSPCRNYGDPYGSYGDEKDIDGEDRIIYGRVDIGADEFYWSIADIDRNGDVNFIDYAIFADDWTKTTGFNEACDLYDNNVIDANDLQLFCAEWLWIAGWRNTWNLPSGGQQQMMMQQQNMLALGQNLELESMTRITQQQTAITEEDVENMVDWLDSIRQDGSLNALTESEFQQFRDAVENSPI